MGRKVPGELSLIVAIEMHGFSAVRSGRQRTLRIAFHRLLDVTVADTGLDRAAPISRIDRGDGVLLILPPAVYRRPAVCERFLTGLEYALKDREVAELRLRVALHLGPVHRTATGHAGAGLITAQRLVDLAPLRELLAREPEYRLTVVTSSTWQDLLRHKDAAGTGDARYVPVVYEGKSGSEYVWIRQQGPRPPTGLRLRTWLRRTVRRRPARKPAAPAGGRPAHATPGGTAPGTLTPDIMTPDYGGAPVPVDPELIDPDPAKGLGLGFLIPLRRVKQPARPAPDLFDLGDRAETPAATHRLTAGLDDLFRRLGPPPQGLFPEQAPEFSGDGGLSR
ncbi:hypothetical protein NX801_27915 [Streptomyces sp. LP05-1]|uniref:Guanylate cyclase domain-containing protein n=1 Tax=Streptomyces pyxinae TaxID=2970734 RepID=A0ABT2CS30_9ACTN|nr:hypothetical protein [Streptomyces sp. LP05-1]MCS0639394.1 hypothetical protein [Streptomyces sp. LP05-1]